MTENDVIDYLKEYRTINNSIEAKTLELQRMKKQNCDLCTLKVDFIRQLTTQLDQDINQLSNDIERLNYRRTIVDSMINSLLPHEKKLLKLRYFEGMKWCVIENMMNYSQRQPFNIHKNIIKKLAKQIRA